MLFSYDAERGIVTATSEFDQDSGCYDHVYLSYALMVVAELAYEAGSFDDAEALWNASATIADAGAPDAPVAPSAEFRVADVIGLMRAFFTSTYLLMDENMFVGLAMRMYDRVGAVLDADGAK